MLFPAGWGHKFHSLSGIVLGLRTDVLVVTGYEVLDGGANGLVATRLQVNELVIMVIANFRQEYPLLYSEIHEEQMF